MCGVEGVNGEKKETSVIFSIIKVKREGKKGNIDFQFFAIKRLFPFTLCDILYHSFTEDREAQI